MDIRLMGTDSDHIELTADTLNLSFCRPRPMQERENKSGGSMPEAGSDSLKGSKNKNKSKCISIPMDSVEP
jgi:hypothetical protein